MSYPSHYVRVRRRTEWVGGLALFGLGLVLAHLLDGPVYHLLLADKESVESADWYQLLRQIGYLPTWIVVALAMWLASGDRASGDRAWGDRALAAGRGVRVVLAAVLAGLVAEVVKRLLGRERPDEGRYVFKPFLSGFADDSNLGFPSSHVAVAVGGCLALARVYPGTLWLMLSLGCGCALTRLLSGAHFLSDCVGGGLVAWVFARLLIPRERYP